jgi:hypothetical protein
MIKQNIIELGSPEKLIKLFNCSLKRSLKPLKCNERVKRLISYL